MPSAAPTPASPAPVSSALSAFLRGIERRAFVFVQVQCGRDEVAQAALGRAMRAFREISAHSPLSAWPAAFWALLVAQAELAEGQSDIPELGALSSGPRAALLLAAGLGMTCLVLSESRGSMAALAKRYQPEPISGLERPKISAAIENSKVHRPSYTGTTTSGPVVDQDALEFERAEFGVIFVIYVFYANCRNLRLFAP